MPAVAGLFKYDVVKFRAANDQYYNAIITDLHDDGTVDVAYVKSSGKGNVQVKYEKNVSYRRFNGAALNCDTILPYKKGDLVRWYLNDDDYYLAHIISVGKVDTVEILLGDVYMGSYVKDRKTGDIMEVNVKDIRYVDDGEKTLTRKEKRKYGYESSELNKDIGKSTADFLKTFLVGAVLIAGFMTLCVLMGFGANAFFTWIENCITKSVYQQDSTETESDNPYGIVLDHFEKYYDESYYFLEYLDTSSYDQDPVKYVMQCLYDTPFDSLSSAQLDYIQSFYLQQYETSYEDNYTYSVILTGSDGNTYHFDFKNKLGIDTYDLAAFDNVTALTLDVDSLKSIEFINEMPQITTLSLEANELKDISPLADTAITQLSLDVPDADLGSGAILFEMPDLEFLEIDNAHDLFDGVTETNSTIKILKTHTVNDQDFLKLFTGIETLCLNTSTFYSPIPQEIFNLDLSYNPNLRFLTLSDVSVDGDVFNQVYDSSIEELTIENSKITIDGSKTADGSQLKKLSIKESTFYDSLEIRIYGSLGESHSGEEITFDDWAGALSNFPNLTELSLVGCNIDDLNEIPLLNKLEVLDVSDNYITDLTPLKDFPSLKELTITDNALTKSPEEYGLKNVDIIN